MMQAVEASLKRLQTDYIDLYWVHIWDGITPLEEVMRGLDDLDSPVDKILYVGISDAPRLQWIAQANTLAELPEAGHRSSRCKSSGTTSWSAGTVERELVPMAKALSVGVPGCIYLSWRVDCS